jgi:cell division protein FtsL
MMIVVVFMGAYYLMLLNDKATVGYKISKLDNRVADLSDINRDLELRVIDLRGVSRIEQRADEMHMVVAENVEYLSESDGSFARR